MKFLLLVFPMVFVGCATYSKKQCQEMDWYVEGKRAALDGYTLKQGKSHFIDKCQENQGVTMSVKEFEKGFAVGLDKLCTPEGLENLKSRDIKYQRTCDVREESMNYEKSHEMELEEKIQKLETENSHLKEENTKLTEELEALKPKD
jgi:predicted RNase H-like nuclease (RuvC/YqgF family)